MNLLKRILNLTTRDFGGCAYRLTQALQESGIEAQHVTGKPHRFGYKHGILTRKKSEIEKWVRWADVVNCWVTMDMLKGIEWPRQLFLTGVGSVYWGQNEKIHQRAERKGFRVLSASSALLVWGAEWLPIAIPAKRWAEYAMPHAGKPIVCQTPSNFDKNTDHIRSALSRLDIEFRVVMNKSHKECLRLKGEADICVGQFLTRGGKGGGYGLSDLEAMTMGIPVITTSPDRVTESYLDTIGYLPYYDATIEKLPEAIDSLLSDTKLYGEYSRRGREYILKYHDYPVVAKRFMDLCGG